MAGSSPEAAVRVRGLVKRYGTRAALDGVEFDVAAGSLHGLLGPNGAGKTTLLRTLFGLVVPDAGDVELLGAPAPRGPGEIDGLAGFVEEPAFYPYLSGRANLELVAALDDPPAAANAEIEPALERVGLAERAEDRVGGYSTGMRQRLGVAGALIRRPQLLLLDEPTSGLDPAGIEAVAELLRELAAGGTTILVSSHQIGELESFCDAHSILHHGRIAWSGSAAQLADEAPVPIHRLQTADDSQAEALARDLPGVEVRPADGALRVTARTAALDGYVLALARRDVPVRALTLERAGLEALFFSLTTDA